MRVAITLSALALTAAVANAAVVRRQNAKGFQNVVYWGQNGGGTVANNDLATYCTEEQGIDVIALAFLYNWGNGSSIASGTIGQSCLITETGEGKQCEALGAAISTCQAKGKKVILSLGGAAGDYSLQNRVQAETIGQNLWEAYGAPSAANTGKVPRPFGPNVRVDGFDFDLERNTGNEHYPFMISKLRGNFACDPTHKYYITGAPQCPLPEPFMGDLIAASQFDYIFIQFYNNDGCSTNGPINFADWKTFISKGASANAKIFIGVPASPLASTGTESGAKYYLNPPALAKLVGQFKADSAFGGIMMWAAGFSDANVNNGCTYAQTAKKILTTGSPC